MLFQFRQVILILIDAVLINLAVYFTMLLRFETLIPSKYMDLYLSNAAVITSVTVLFFILSKLYSRIWEYASIGEMLSILKATTISIISTYLLINLMGIDGMPRSIYIGSWLMISLLVGGSRLSWRLFRDHGLKKSSGPFRRVLIVGAGDAGAALVKEIHNNPQLHLQAAAFIDDDPAKRKKILNGVPVLGNHKKIPALVKTRGIDEILIAMPSVSGEKVRDIIDTCHQTPARVKILPGIYESSSQNLFANVRDVQMEDLLKRDPIRINLDEVAACISNKTVLISGAGGSIGSELCRQVLKLRPSKLVMVDNCENNLFDIEMELFQKSPAAMVSPELVDVRNRDKLDRVFKKHRPQVIFHAAAYKHVPMMERHPDEALDTNVFGSRNVAELSDHYGAESFILISTDKAVNPTSVMGASKRIAELLIKDINRESKTRFAAVRFGNVLGSRGSVIPTFMKQIEKGGPLTVTHPDMKRYFMTIPEAVQLVIQAGAMAKGGEIFVLDMGEQVKIEDLARDLIRLAGYQPDIDIPIVHTGIRPGEKLYEELFTERENMDATKHKRIFISSKELDANYIDIHKRINLLSQKQLSNHNEALKLIIRAVPEYQHEEIGQEPEVEAVSS